MQGHGKFLASGGIAADPTGSTITPMASHRDLEDSGG